MLMVAEERKFNILVPETIDTLVQAILWWYKEECNHEDDIPNLHGVLNDEHIYSDMFYESFVTSLCWSKYRLGIGKNPESEEFNDASYDDAMSELSECFNHYYPLVCRDVTSILNEMQLSYTYHNWDSGIGELGSYKNTSILGVW